MNQDVIGKIRAVLETVKDPEINSVSVIDLGMIESICYQSGKAVIQALPTFMGCPALEIIQKNIVSAVMELDEISSVQVEFIYSPPWTSDRITDEGRERLKEFGIAPPPVFLEEAGMWKVDCPYCGSGYTTLENIFGPTACRSILYCKSCKNPFEAMKPISTLM
ncbi:phenylacetate-CoA oxygenase subunit PaaJ [Bacillus sp. FJAT-42376]|uniref:1,2-phenylacetyl-CoA epoxidase subunit PaaD n=1 Tax=Bacillus sp. FJAT-42376 TaxID=2014076 RepID=UPI000F4DFCF6|nr:1,2-phenylacetyl-CoA epoxidase subunit PaaD [Bacillus sp. FJAT-42376]AZB41431.1 phenylacetate-CoA oxygenase subunit PaaJ [Bacillus sp. FJAT-42376]